MTFALLRLTLITCSILVIYHYYGDKVIGALGYGDELVNTILLKDKKELPLEEIERSVNATLPIYSDDGNARWDSFKLSPYLATYHVVLTNVNKADLGQVYFGFQTHRKFISEICKMEGVEKFVENDIAFRISFYDQSEEFIESISAESTECRHRRY